MFRRVLVANRGVIACRIIRTLRRMGVGSVAVYSAADRQALHVLQADEAIAIGAAPAAESYLSQDAILRAARDSGCRSRGADRARAGLVLNPTAAGAGQPVERDMGSAIAQGFVGRLQL